MTNFKTPGVIVKEKSTFPPSIAQVKTAVPAFIGYTEIAEKDGQNLTNIPTKIRSMLEFRTYFGEAPSGELSVTLDDNHQVTKVQYKPSFLLYNCMQMFYANGGGDCYILSVGDYTTTTKVKKHFEDGIKALKKYDEPTLYVAPEAILLGSGDCETVQNKMLDDCELLGDRFAILDVIDTDDLDADSANFRNAITNNSSKKYGAAYYPYLKTQLPINYLYSDLSFKKNNTAFDLSSIINTGDSKDILDDLENIKKDINEIENDLNFVSDYSLNEYKNITGANNTEELNNRVAKIVSLINGFKNKSINYDASKVNALFADGLTFHQILNSLNEITQDGVGIVGNDLEDLSTLVVISDIITSPNSTITYGTLPSLTGNVDDNFSPIKLYLEKLYTATYSIVEDVYRELVNLMESKTLDLASNSAIFANITKGIQRVGIVLPPSSSLAGIYAKTDNLVGVWKSPGNISLNYVSTPTVIISDEDQAEMNVHETGKSINAIRPKTGKGIMVWGVRTLDGNSSEWRSISVRRLFNMIEESAKKATEQFIFESNDAFTWLQIKSMLNNYLNNLWQAGALAGAVEEHAYNVAVGLNETMTAQDILDLKINVEISIAPVRPAEFITLTFSQKLQES